MKNNAVDGALNLLNLSAKDRVPLRSRGNQLECGESQFHTRWTCSSAQSSVTLIPLMDHFTSQTRHICRGLKFARWKLYHAQTANDQHQIVNCDRISDQMISVLEIQHSSNFESTEAHFGFWKFQNNVWWWMRWKSWLSPKLKNIFFPQVHWAYRGRQRKAKGLI